MTTQKEQIILYTDEEAAKLITITGWVSRNGRFFGENEQSARYDGCTHKQCDCGSPMTKGWTKCENCRSKSSQDKYASYEYKEWDGVTPVCIFGDDTYFFGSDEIDDYLEEHELQYKDLHLVLCKPNYAKHIYSEYWEDIFAEDGDIPTELQKKLDELNKYIDTLEPISWSPSNIRTEYKG